MFLVNIVICMSDIYNLIVKYPISAKNDVQCHPLPCYLITVGGGGPRVVVSTAAFHARVRGSVPGFGGLKETKMFLLRFSWPSLSYMSTKVA